MSVEKRVALEDTTAASGSGRDTAKTSDANKSPSLVPSSSTSEPFQQEKKTGKSVGSTESVLPGSETEKGEKMVQSANAREWFRGLAPEERSCAAAIWDGAFLATFLAIAAPWSTSAGGAAAGVKSMNWDTMVSLEEFESKYMESQGTKSSSTLTKEKTAAVSVSKGKGGHGGGKATKVNNKGAKKDIESTALRIEQKNDSPAPFAKQLCDKVAVILPSAAKHVTGKEADEPCLVLRPSLFERDEELFLALDSITSAYGKAQFLSFTVNETDESLHWLKRLAGDKKAIRSVPLYILLLARFEWAAWEAFREWEHRRTKLNGTRLLMQVPLGDLFGHCRALDELALTVDSTTLSTIMAPLVNACTPPKHSPQLIGVGQVDNVILTPLSWLMLAKKQKGLVDFDTLDKAVGASLKRMKEHEALAALFKEANADQAGATHAAPKSQTVTSQQSNDEPAEQKKKKKKPKKRKSKKGPTISPSTMVSKNPTQSLESSETASKDKAVAKNEIAQVEQRISAKPSEKTDASRARRDSHASAASVESDTTSDIASKGTFQSSSTESKRAEDISVSHHDGRFVVAPSASEKAAPSETASKSEGTDSSEGRQGHSDDLHVWETVEVRSRGNRRKPSDRSHHGGSRHLHNSASTVVSHESHGGSHKKPKNRRTCASRKGNANRKMVREILVSVVDSAGEEAEARRRKQAVPSPPRPASMNSWKKGPPGAKQPIPSPRKDFAAIVSGVAKSEPTMRDVVLGKSTTPQPRVGAAAAVPPKEKRLPRLDQASTVRETPKKVIATPGKKSPAKHGKSEPGVTADQNTAPTFQETVSAFSAVSSPRVHSKDISDDKPTQSSKSGSSSGDTDEAIQDRDREGLRKASAVAAIAPTPPLPTLLSPENANSANSSVASSLEAPHAGHMHHHSKTAVDVNDVGYHLLDVCDRLSRDMSLFMSRRALALSARRRERGALLAALQETVSSIWPGQCHVELYGSCATQLDLPASDLDVVVRGLDRNVEMANVPVLGVSHSHSGSSDSIGPSMSMEESSTADESQQQPPPMQQHVSAAMYNMMPVHLNGERVMRLAAELENQSWAVHVNAIPTASVPVIKILADPSRISGASNGGDWMVHHRHLAAQAAAAAGGKGHGHDSIKDQDHLASRHELHSQPTILPWRGSDVMNGLLSLDITFEGPEHGGVGSTEFSASAVAEACAEAGLHPDATPFVQVVMVLKELLAQRKLNEPYSGGLSSYALLLLVLALVRERAVIRAEIERVELQKRAMAAAELNSIQAQEQAKAGGHQTTLKAPPERNQSLGRKAADTDDEKVNSNKTPQVANKKSPRKAEAKGKGTALPTSDSSTAGRKPAPSSWANIAKPKTPHKPQPKPSQTVAATPSKKPSFADAVAKSSSAAPVPEPPSVPDRKESGTTVRTANPRKDGTKKRNDASTSTTVSTSKVSSTTDAPSTAVPSSGSAAPATPATPVGTTPAATTPESSVHAPVEYYPQGFNDVVEVLCSGETTAGKLLMHFLLFYGQHFDAQTTAIDISGKHERYSIDGAPYSYVSPYIPRRAPGSIDPVTGMLTVDPIVIYDPLEGAENNNVSRRCFAWSSVRWIFAQSYATLASAVERSATPPTTPGGGGKSTTMASGCEGKGKASSADFYNSDQIGDLLDPSSPLLRCLLSF